MDRKQEVRDIIEKYITSNREERRDQCTFGVEIETQLGDEKGGFWSIVYDNLEQEDYMDTDEYYKCLSKCVDDYLQDSPLSEMLSVPVPYFKVVMPAYRVVRNTRWGDQLLTEPSYRRIIINAAIERIRRIEERINEPNDESIKVKLFNKYCTMLEPIESLSELNERLDFAIERYVIEDIDESIYYYEEDDIRQKFPTIFDNLCCDHNRVEIVTDQSVSGQELRTIGGLTHEHFKDAAKSIFNTIDASNHEIDTECSAHIHIKLGNIDHYYGNGSLHAAMMEYITFNLDRLPKSVLDRLYHINRWIRPSVGDGNDKYQWIHIHGQGTIEFRLFGNISNLDDLLASQELALDALAYAYQVRFGDFERALKDHSVYGLISTLYLEPLNYWSAII